MIDQARNVGVFVSNQKFFERRFAMDHFETLARCKLLFCITSFLKRVVCRFLESRGAQQGKVDRRTQGEERLVGANVARCLIAANMLFACLQGQYPTSIATTVGSLPSDSTWKTTNQFLATCHDAKIRAAVSEPVAEALAFCNGDVYTKIAGAF